MSRPVTSVSDSRVTKALTKREVVVPHTCWSDALGLLKNIKAICRGGGGNVTSDSAIRTACRERVAIVAIVGSVVAKVKFIVPRAHGGSIAGTGFGKVAAENVYARCGWIEGGLGCCSPSCRCAARVGRCCIRKVTESKVCIPPTQRVCVAAHLVNNVKARNGGTGSRNSRPRRRRQRRCGGGGGTCARHSAARCDGGAWGLSRRLSDCLRHCGSSRVVGGDLC
mmetsp:Transcript_33114/g.86592  ORF Transcript_33114/g.86592 Transcript_33114/m.86592 type:complete len:224 (-) Transcript_33114:236-907(-)